MKLFLVLIIIFFLPNCSFDNKTGIWKDTSKINSKKIDKYNDLKEAQTSNIKFFDKLKNLDKDYIFEYNKKIINKSWSDFFYSKGNYLDNFSYNNNNNIIFTGKKLTRTKINEQILFDKNILISTDQKGNIIIYSIKEKKILHKYNFYKKKFKNIKKNIYIGIKNKILYVSDNIGYVYAYDFIDNKIIWAKDYKVPFRSNIKLANNKIFLSDQNNNLLILDKNDGDLLRKIPTEEIVVKNKFVNNLSIYQNNLYFLNTFGSLYSVDITNFKINWFLNLNLSINSNYSNLFNAKPILSINDNLIIATKEQLYSLDAQVGVTKFKLPIKIKTTPVVTKSYIYLITNNDLLVALNQNTGNIIYSYDIKKKLNLFTDKKLSKLNIHFFRLIGNELCIFLNDSQIVKFDLRGEVKEVQKLKKKIQSNPIFIDSSIIYLDRSQRTIILD
jgi:outer membrane protein assembly factor BamB